MIKLKFAFKHSNLFSFVKNRVRVILGTNLALAIVAASVIPSGTNLSLASVEEKQVISVKTTQFTTEKAIQFPLGKVSVTQKFYLFHPGVDLDGITGDPVKPIQGGIVQKIQYSRLAYGNAILINHGNEITSLYAHLSKILVKEGDSVTTDTIIGLVGSTGRSTGDHLHLEVRIDGRAVNPFSILPKVNSTLSQR